MWALRRTRAVLSLLVFCSYAFAAWGGRSNGPEQATQQPNPSRAVGVIKTISGSTIALTQDSGSDINVLLQDSTRLVRIPPGEKSLKNAIPIQVQELQAGDRILVYGKPTEDTKSLNASTIVVMKQTDVAAKQAQDREDWQKRGLGGVVTTVDATHGSLVISQPSPGTKKEITIRTTKGTVVRRYAPDSVNPEDAKLAPLSDATVGDQVLARGGRNADGSEMVAEEILFGSFGSIDCTVVAADPAGNTITVLDLASKKPVAVKVTSQSLLRRLPEPMAQRIAAYLKGGAGGVPGASGNQAPPSNTNAPPSPSPQGGSAGTGEHAHMHGPPDIQQMVQRAPPFNIAELKKGDALMILFSKQAGVSGGVTAIQLVAGVEPILQASPKGGQGMILSPWSLGGGGGEAESQ